MDGIGGGLGDTQSPLIQSREGRKAECRLANFSKLANVIWSIIYVTQTLTPDAAALYEIQLVMMRVFW